MPHQNKSIFISTAIDGLLLSDLHLGLSHTLFPNEEEQMYGRRYYTWNYEMQLQHKWSETLWGINSTKSNINEE